MTKKWMTSKQAHDMRALIEDRYPHVAKIMFKTSWYKPRGDYCVGGAIVLYSLKWYEKFWIWFTENRYWYAYPLSDLLAKRLKVLNPDLDECDSLYYAATIIECNDRGMFDKAWDCFEKAMSDNPYAHTKEMK